MSLYISENLIDIKIFQIIHRISGVSLLIEIATQTFSSLFNYLFHCLLLFIYISTTNIYHGNMSIIMLDNGTIALIYIQKMDFCHFYTIQCLLMHSPTFNDL